MARTAGKSKSFTTIARVSPSEQIREQITEAIADGTYPVGSFLPSERLLCESFGVSRVSVREALAGLQAVGLVEIRHGKGAMVLEAPTGDYATPFGKYLDLFRQDLVELLKVRQALDELAAVEAAQNPEPQARERLRQACEAFADVAGRSPQSLTELAERDEQFHLAVAVAAGGKLLPALVEQLNGVLEPSRRLTLSQDGQVDRSVAEHRRIVDAIVANDAPAARKAAGDHLASIVAWLASGQEVREPD